MSFVESNSGGEGQLVLPLDRKSFGDFIIGLLGQRRSIEKTFDEYRFYIDLNWLLDIDKVIEQRAAQNESSLVAFSARLFFDDGRIVTVTSQPSFYAFRDMSTRVAIGVEVRWTYLIKFPTKEIPERQEISFRAFTDSSSADTKPTKSPSKSFVKASNAREKLFFSVQFSDLTWGEDFSNHLIAFVEAKTERLGKVTKFIRSTDSSLLIPIMFPFIMATTIFVMPAGSESRKISLKYNVVPDLSAVMQDVAVRSNFLIDAAGVSLVRDSVLWPIMSVVAVMTAILIGWWAVRARKMSFISLNEYSERYYKRYNHRFEIVKYGVLLASIVGIVGGIFSNRIYDFLKTSGVF